MASGESEKAKESVTSVKRSKTVDPDQETPTYYDSEPSSQPPNYTQAKGKTRTKSAPSSVPHAEHRGSGVPLATLSVFLADPGPEPEKVKRSLSQRWKDWRNRKSDDEPINRYAWARGPNGSSAQWNVFGSTVSGRSRR